MNIFKNIKPAHYVAIVSLVIVATVGAYALNGSKAMQEGNGMYDISVSGVKLVDATGSVGVKRASINVSVANLGNEVLQVSPGMQMTLITDSGKPYSVTAKYLSENEVIGGPVETGDTKTMIVDYEIPSSETPDKLIYQKDLATPQTEVKL